MVRRDRGGTEGLWGGGGSALVAKVHTVGARSVEAYDGKTKLDVREAVFTMVE